MTSPIIQTHGTDARPPRGPKDAMRNPAGTLAEPPPSLPGFDRASPTWSPSTVVPVHRGPRPPCPKATNLPARRHPTLTAYGQSGLTESVATAALLERSDL